MENRIKVLYILSIIVILTFLGMQTYWLYARYEYSLREYEDNAIVSISNILDEYINSRPFSHEGNGSQRYSTVLNLSPDTTNRNIKIQLASVSVKIFDGKRLLGISENRNLTQQEKKRLNEISLDSVGEFEERKASVDISNIPSSKDVWSAMTRFQLEVANPFDATHLESLLQKEEINANISLMISDSIIWDPIIVRHKSILNPYLKFIASYSEPEHKVVVIESPIPMYEVIKSMGWTLSMALIMSILLIFCLVWQIKTIAKLTRLDKMRNSFITTMIHELKRPISTLKMCVSGIDNDKLMEDTQLRHELTAETRIALDNLSAYFSKLRDITFNNVEQIPLNVTSFNLSELVDNMIKSIALPTAKEVVFENTISEDFEISADRSHLMNILTNLIENAIKYSGNKVTIKIKGASTPDGCILSVEDNGNGISPADKLKIFNRFYRGKASSTDIPGMGLGLAYVKLLVEAHGGCISVDSEEGVGSTFNITLPQ